VLKMRICMANISRNRKDFANNFLKSITYQKIFFYAGIPLITNKNTEFVFNCDESQEGIIV